MLVEIKSKMKVDESDAKHLKSLGDDLEVSLKKSKKPAPLRILLSQDPLDQKWDSIRALQWEKGIEFLLSSGQLRNQK